MVGDNPTISNSRAIFFAPPRELSLLAHGGGVGSYDQGAYYPARGFLQVMRALLRTIREQPGCATHLSTEVTAIEVRGGRARSLTTATGDVFLADTVLFDGDAQLSMDLIGQTLGQYHIVEAIGHGGMAWVFKARQPALDRDVAVKVLLPQRAGTPEFRERFIREAKAIAQLNHPNILPIIDYGQDDDLIYLVMKYVAGGTLAERLKRPIDLATTTGLIAQIAAALDHAHQRRTRAGSAAPRTRGADTLSLGARLSVGLAHCGTQPHVHPRTAPAVAERDRD